MANFQPQYSHRIVPVSIFPPRNVIAEPSVHWECFWEKLLEQLNKRRSIAFLFSPNCSRTPIWRPTGNLSIRTGICQHMWLASSEQTLGVTIGWKSPHKPFWYISWAHYLQQKQKKIVEKGRKGKTAEISERIKWRNLSGIPEKSHTTAKHLSWYAPCSNSAFKNPVKTL